MNLEELSKLANSVRQKYDDLNELNTGTPWTPRDYMAGFVGDVGDLSKIIMAKNKLRTIDAVDEKLEHELADCLWSILILAEAYNIDIETVFIRTMRELETRINARLVA